MENKVVLITGASSGIGKALAISFAKNNYKVIINYNKSEKEAKELANQICADGHSAICIKADISKESDIKNMVNQAITIFGHIDVLINNAGICGKNLLIDETSVNINNIISTNLTGTILCSQEVCKHMLSYGKGKIINISSIWGLYGASCETVYSASKGGIIAFTKALAKELAYNKINVNCIAPGVVDTKMLKEYNDEEINILKNEIPFNRFASTNEIAKVALFLASPDSDYITGQTLQIDGGFCL